MSWRIIDFTDVYRLTTNETFPVHRRPEVLEILNSQRATIDKMDYKTRELYYIRLSTDMFRSGAPLSDHVNRKSSPCSKRPRVEE
jgi:hypothetical protein